MKQVCLLTLLLLSRFAFSQQVSIEASGELAVSAANSFLGIQQNKVLANDLSISNIRGSVGAGFATGLDLGLGLNNYISLHLGYAGFFGNKSVFLHNELGGVYQHIEGKTSQKRILPGIHFQIPGKKIDFFMRAALLLPLGSETEFNREESGMDGTANQYAMNYNVQYNWSVGYQQAIGFSIKAGKQFQIQAAVQSYLLNLTAKSQTMTAYEVNGADQLSSLTTYQKEILYRDDLNNFNNNDDYNTLYNSDKAKEGLTYSQSFNSLSLQLKIVYLFKNKN